MTTEIAKKPETTALAKPEKAESINDFIEKQSPEFGKALEGSGLTTQKFARVAITTIRGNEKLMRATGISLLAALMKAAQAGLLPDGRRAYLIPRENRYGNEKIMEATYMIGYQGMVEIALRDSEMLKISSAVVFAKDKFVYELGLNEKLEHVPSCEPDRGEKLFVYAIAKMKNGQAFFEVLDKSAVDRARASSSGWQYDTKTSPWTTHTESMWRKTAVRALFKYLPNLDVSEAIAGEDVDFSPVVQSDDATKGMTGLKAALIPKAEEPPPVAEEPPTAAVAAPSDPITKATATTLKRIASKYAGKGYIYIAAEIDKLTEGAAQDFHAQMESGDFRDLPFLVKA